MITEVNLICLTAQKIDQWLSPPRMLGNYNAACEILRNQPDSTCSWFLNGEKFFEWLKEPGFLWVKGKCKLANELQKFEMDTDTWTT